MSPAITYENLHRLWPRGDGAVRMLMYLWRIVCQGYVPNFTDAQLAKRFFRQPATIRRWRARWEAKGILITSFRYQRTFYEINLVALQEAIQAAIEEEEAREQEAKARRLEQKTKRYSEISQKLAQQWRQTHLAGDQNDLLEPIKTQGSKTSNSLNQSSVPGKPGKGLAANAAGVAGRLRTTRDDSQYQGTEAQQLDLVEPFKQNASSDKMRLWMIEAARRLVEQNGQRWNCNLQRLLDGLETKAIVRAVSSLWEQIQKGNVRNAPKFLTRAVQRKYCCTKGWTLPDALPLGLSHHAPNMTASSAVPLFPDWLPMWAVKLLEKLAQQGQQLCRYELVDGGLQVWTEAGIQFFPHREPGLCDDNELS